MKICKNGHVYLVGGCLLDMCPICGEQLMEQGTNGPVVTVCGNANQVQVSTRESVERRST